MAVFTNQATLSYNGISTSSNIVTGEIAEDLAVQKNAAADAYVSGDELTYTVSIRNTGANTLTGLTVTDDLGAYPVGTATAVPLTYISGSVLYYLNGALQPTPAVTIGPPLVISGIDIPAGGSAVLVYRARVNGFAPLAAGSSITNTAAVSRAERAEAVTAAETVPAGAAPNLSITKSLNPAVVTEAGQLTYTFTIQNTGAAPADAGAGIVLDDTFSPVLNNITATLDGEVWPALGNYTYDTTTGEFVTVYGRITVPAATYTQDPATGAVTTVPGVTTLTVSGTV